MRVYTLTWLTGRRAEERQTTKVVLVEASKRTWKVVAIAAVVALVPLPLIGAFLGAFNAIMISTVLGAIGVFAGTYRKSNSSNQLWAKQLLDKRRSQVGRIKFMGKVVDQEPVSVQWVQPTALPRSATK